MDIHPQLSDGFLYYFQLFVVGDHSDLPVTLELREEVGDLESSLLLLQSDSNFSKGILSVGRNTNDRLVLVCEFLVDVFLVFLRIMGAFLDELHIAVEIGLNALALLI